MSVCVVVVAIRALELCESRGGRPGLPVLNKPTVSVDVKQHFNQLRLLLLCRLYESAGVCRSYNYRLLRNNENVSG